MNGKERELREEKEVKEEGREEVHEKGGRVRENEREREKARMREARAKEKDEEGRARKEGWLGKII